MNVSELNVSCIIFFVPHHVSIMKKLEFFGNFSFFKIFLFSKRKIYILEDNKYIFMIFNFFIWALLYPNLSQRPFLNF